MYETLDCPGEFMFNDRITLFWAMVWFARISLSTCLLLFLLVGSSLVWRGVSGITVHVFLSTECPISQHYARQLSELHAHYEPLGIRFVAWFPLSTDSRTRIRRFSSDYSLTIQGRPDPIARQLHRLKAHVTPEVVVVGPTGQVQYRGAIDNRYAALGRHRPEATRHYLRDALDALLTNRPILQPHTEPIGCLID